MPPSPSHLVLSSSRPRKRATSSTTAAIVIVCAASSAVVPALPPATLPPRERSRTSPQVSCTAVSSMGHRAAVLSRRMLQIKRRKMFRRQRSRSVRSSGNCTVCVPQPQCWNPGTWVPKIGPITQGPIIRTEHTRTRVGSPSLIYGRGFTTHHGHN